MAKDEFGNLIHKDGHGPRCHVDQDRLVKAFDVALAFHRANTNDPHGIGNAVIASLEEVKTVILAALR